VSVLGDRLGEDQLPGPPAFLLPRLARLDRAGEHVARLHVAVVLEVLLGVESCAAASATTPFTLYPGGLATRTEPWFADLGPQEVVRVELGAGLSERRWGDDVADLGALGVVLVVVDGVGVSHAAGEHHDVACLDGEPLDCHGRSLLCPCALR